MNSSPAPLCTHMKMNGTRCGSPAVKGTELCFHHSAVKSALGKATPLDQVSYGSFTPIPFVFPEDRVAIQINYFLLLQALNEQRVEKRAADLMLRMLRSMDRNLGKSGSLVDAASEQVSEPTAQEVSESAGERVSEIASGNDATRDEMTAHNDQRISTVNAAAPCYPDYREVNALHPAGQKVLNMYCQPPKDR